MTRDFQSITRELLDELESLDQSIPLPERVRTLMQGIRTLQEGGASESIFRTIYKSRSLINHEGEALLLAQSRNNNSLLGVTGALLHYSGYFLQVLEGSEEAVNELVRRIKNDPRHTDFVLLYAGAAPSRVFRHWTMGSMTLDRTSFNNLIKACKEQDNRVTRLLIDFVEEGTWR